MKAIQFEETVSGEAVEGKCPLFDRMLRCGKTIVKVASSIYDSQRADRIPHSPQHNHTPRPQAVSPPTSSSSEP